MQPEVDITWVGHATVLFEVDGFRVITDPILTSRVVHLRRRVEVPVIDPVDVVLISHLHMDHLHLRSLRAVSRGARLVAPAGAAKLFRSLDVTALDEVVAGDIVTLREPADGAPAITARVVPADHSNARGPHSRLVAEPVGYILEAGSRAVYFAGDTDLFDEMTTIGRAHDLDVALIPVWGWGPTLGRGRHLDPVSAATAVARLRPRLAVPIHWGTYWPHALGRVRPALLVEPPATFAEAVADAAPAVLVRVTEVGSVVDLTGLPDESDAE
jgi:L-ascorbate metabolism protein UlaG (beta-lactamase superfamily)